MRKSVLAVAAFICTLSISGCALQPYDNSITTDALEIAAQTCDYILVKVSDSLDVESPVFSYYELPGATEFSELFDFGNWSISKTAPQGTPALILCFAEAWILELYQDGTAWACNGYAKSGTQSNCYYTFSNDTLDYIVTYIEEYSTPHTLGDGTISIGTFHH